MTYLLYGFNEIRQDNCKQKLTLRPAGPNIGTKILLLECQLLEIKGYHNNCLTGQVGLKKINSTRLVKMSIFMLI